MRRAVDGRCFTEDFWTLTLRGVRLPAYPHTHMYHDSIGHILVHRATDWTADIRHDSPRGKVLLVVEEGARTVQRVDDVRDRIALGGHRMVGAQKRLQQNELKA
jgi:hypothetical protein